MEFLKLAKERYSCKKFSDKQVEPDKLSAILEAGRLAPTAKNLQPQRIYVIQSQSGLAKVDALTPCRYGAPTVLAVAFDRDEVYHFSDTRDTSGVEDASIVATHMMLCAADLGVDSCWLNYYDHKETGRALGLPENQEVVLLLDLGYAASEGGAPLPNHDARKSLSETVRYL